MEVLPSRNGTAPSPANGLTLTLSAEQLAELEDRVAARVLASLKPAPESPYLAVDEAAAYLRCSRQRIYDLLSEGRLSRHKDGARVLSRRDELDRHVGGGGVALGRPTGRLNSVRSGISR